MNEILIIIIWLCEWQFSPLNVSNFDLTYNMQCRICNVSRVSKRDLHTCTQNVQFKKLFEWLSSRRVDFIARSTYILWTTKSAKRKSYTCLWYYSEEGSRENQFFIQKSLIVNISEKSNTVKVFVMVIILDVLLPSFILILHQQWPLIIPSPCRLTKCL